MKNLERFRRYWGLDKSFAGAGSGAFASAESGTLLEHGPTSPTEGDPADDANLDAKVATI
jgi:hypothetical protein